MENLDFLKGKTILVSGATGMIGSQIIKRVLESNDKIFLNTKIIALYRNEKKKEQTFVSELKRTDIYWYRCDICEPITLTEPIDFIIHTAGVTGGSEQHIDFPIRTITTAINGTVNMLNLGKTKGLEGFIYLSSLEIYGKTDFSKPTIKEIDGGYIDSMGIRSSYSESKRMCETICAAYAKQYGVPAKVVRLTATYGAGASYEDKRVLCEFSRCIIKKKDIVLRSQGDTVRNYCDVSDAVSAILCVLEKGGVGKAYNIANMDTEISIKDLAKRFVKLYPYAGIKVRFDLPEDISVLGYNQTVKIRLDSKKLGKLGWKPVVGIDQMIKNLVDAMIISKTQREEMGYDKI